MEGKGPPSDGQSTQNALNRFAEKKLSPNNGQSNGREDTPPDYIRSSADTPISDSACPPSRGSPPASPATRIATSTASREAAAPRSRGSSPPTRRPPPAARRSRGCRPPGGRQ